LGEGIPDLLTEGRDKREEKVVWNVKKRALVREGEKVAKTSD
jgi:hypothetical protein